MTRAAKVQAVIVEAVSVVLSPRVGVHRDGVCLWCNLDRLQKSLIDLGVLLNPDTCQHRGYGGRVQCKRPKGYGQDGQFCKTHERAHRITVAS